MIEHILNLQNKKAMKRDIKVEFLYLFIHAPCMLELFPRKKTQTTLKLRLLNWSDPGYCGYEAAPEKQGRIRHKPLYWEKPLQQPSKLQWQPAPACCCPEHAWQVADQCAFLLQLGKSKNSKRFVRYDLLTKALLILSCYSTFIYTAPSFLLAIISTRVHGREFRPTGLYFS